MAITYQVFGTTTLGTATQFITFDNIPQTCTDLVLHLRARGNRPGFIYQDVLGIVSGYADSMFGQYLSGSAGSVGAGNINDRFWFNIPAGTSPANYFSLNRLYLHNYTNAISPTGTGTPKMLQMEEAYSSSSTTANGTVCILRNLIFTRNDAVTSISFGTQTDAFVAGTSATLYGIKRA